jgi:hypothetical protein
LKQKFVAFFSVFLFCILVTSDSRIRDYKSDKVPKLDKTKLLLLPFFVGLTLLICSWYLTYPISAISSNDFAFYHISILYWFSLPLLWISMFLMALTTKNNFLKWILSIGIVLTFFSVFYFYSMIPGADSQYFRGLTEYFIKTRDLNSSQLNHNYYQWPAFFILADIVTSISGLSLPSYEFLLYTIIAFLLATTLYVYASKKHKLTGYVMVAAFFISITYFLNYQSVPFSLALGLLFLLFMLETQKKNAASIATLVLLYASILITHLFVPLFFVLYSVMRSLLDKNIQDRSFYRNFSVFALVSYFAVQITIAKFNFAQLVINITKEPTTYSGIISQSLATQTTNPINIIAQFFSRAVTIAAVGMCIVGLFLLLIKREMGVVDKAIFLAGLLYPALGTVLNTIGFRAIAMVFIPISLGAAFLFKSKFKRYIAGLFLVVLVLFLFVPLHLSFNSEIQFQTRETYLADNFFIDHYNWQKPGFVIADFRTTTYLESKLNSFVFISNGLQAGGKLDAMLYTPQYIGSNFGNYSSMESLSQGKTLDLLYNDGFSYVLINGLH